MKIKLIWVAVNVLAAVALVTACSYDPSQKSVAQSVPVAEVQSLERGVIFEMVDNKGRIFRWLVASGPKVNSFVMTARQILDNYGRLGPRITFHVPTLRKILNETRQ